MTNEDYGTVCSILEQVDRLHRDHVPKRFRCPDGPPRELDWVQARLDDPAIGAFVAEQQGRVVGHLEVELRDAPEFLILEPGRTAVLDGIAVHEQARGTGVGRALMQPAERWAREQGASRVEPQVYEFNERAIGFYERLGYTTVRRVMERAPRARE